MRACAPFWFVSVDACTKQVEVASWLPRRRTGSAVVGPVTVRGDLEAVGFVLL